MNPQIFHLQRDRDISGVSGTGRVANGVLWPDGTVTLRWTGDRPSTVHWERLADAIAIHGHGGATRLVWATPQPPAADQTATPSTAVRQTLRRWAYAAGHIEAELDGAVDRMYELVARDVRRRMADETATTETRVAHWRPVPLATPCLNCGHPYNWHTSQGACAAQEDACGCRSFDPGQRPEPVDPRGILGADPEFAAGAPQNGAQPS